MKKIILLLTLLITTLCFAQVNTTTTTAGKFKMNIPDPGAKKDSIVVWDGTSKLLKVRPVSQISGATNLDQLVAPTGISIFSSTGTDIVLPLATATNAGLLAPAEKTKLASISGTNTGDQDLSGLATTTAMNAALNAKENLSSKGVSNGYAGLDASGKVPLTQINDALLGSVNYQGTYNAATNSPALPAVSTANKGFYYVVSAAGTQAGLTLNAGDWIISNGTAWGKIDNNNAVTAVNGFAGNVSLSTSNIAEGSNLYYTDARVNGNASVAASAASRHNALTLGTANGLSLSTQALSLGLASTNTTGALSSTDWNKFNNKQTAISGTANYLTKYGTGGVVQSLVFESGGNLGLNTTDANTSPNNTSIYFNQGAKIQSRNNFPQLSLSSNIDGDFYAATYKTNNPATQILLDALGGIIDFRTAASGVAGNNIAWLSRLAILSNGNVLINNPPTDNGQGVIQANGNITASPATQSNQVTTLGQFGSNAFNSTAFLPLSGGTLSGSITAPAFFQSSDRRLKTILKRDGDVAYFKWKDKRDTQTHIGYIAQEVKQEFPDQVQQDEKGLLSVNYIEVLVAKVQALEKRIQELEQKK